MCIIICSQWTNNRRLLHTCQLRTRGWVGHLRIEWVEGDGFVIFSVDCCSRNDIICNNNTICDLSTHIMHTIIIIKWLLLWRIIYKIDRIILCDTTTAVIRDAMTPKRAYYCDTRLSTVWCLGYNNTDFPAAAVAPSLCYRA